jgi:hypothetical protein
MRAHLHAMGDNTMGYVAMHAVNNSTTYPIKGTRKPAPARVLVCHRDLRTGADAKRGMPLAVGMMADGVKAHDGCRQEQAAAATANTVARMLN